MTAYVIPNAGTILIRDGFAERVLGTILVDDDSAVLHTEDGTSVVLADDAAGVAFIRQQAGLPFTAALKGHDPEERS